MISVYKLVKNTLESKYTSFSSSGECVCDITPLRVNVGANPDKN